MKFSINWRWLDNFDTIDFRRKTFNFDVISCSRPLCFVSIILSSLVTASIIQLTLVCDLTCRLRRCCHRWNRFDQLWITWLPDFSVVFFQSLNPFFQKHDMWHTSSLWTGSWSPDLVYVFFSNDNNIYITIFERFFFSFNIQCFEWFDFVSIIPAYNHFKCAKIAYIVWLNVVDLI